MLREMARSLLRRSIRATATRGGSTRILAGLCRGMRVEWDARADPVEWALGSWEPHFQRTLRRLVPVGGHCLDVGAHVGTHTLAMSRLVGPSGSVIAFEPLTAGRLCRNVALNALTQVRVEPVALGAIDGTAVLRVPADGGAAMGSILWHEGAGCESTLTVPVRRLDSFHIPRVDLVKIDVEGAEGMVLEGAVSVLSANRPVVLMEVSDSGRASAWSVLRELGYAISDARTHQPMERYEDFRHRDVLATNPRRDAG